MTNNYEKKDTGSPQAVIYLRVSTREQAERDGDPEGYSLPAQREACIRKAKSLDAIVVEEFVDRGESAKTAARPELQRMLAYVAEHPVTYVIVHKVDRLARNRADDVAINITLQQAGVKLVSVTENIDDTPSGALLHGIMSSIAEFYSRNLANEVMKGTIQKAKSGGTPSRAPLGYRNVRRNENGVEQRTVEVDPERAPLITWAFEAYATGEWTTRGLLAELTDRGLRTLPTPKSRPKVLSPSQIHRILHHPYYTGVVRYRGVLYPGKHEAIVSETTWQKVQEVLVAKNLAGEKQREHHHYLKGTVFCGGCGSRLVVNHSKNRHDEVYRYFICIGRHQKRTDCKQKAVLIDEVEERVAALYADVKLTDEQVAEIQDFILRDLQTFQESSRQERDTQRSRLRRLDDERKKLLEAHYAGAVPLDLLKTEQGRLAHEITVARDRLKAVEQEFGETERCLRRAMVLARDCEVAYRGAADSVRRKFNRTFFRMVLVNDEGLVSGELAEPFDVLLGEELRRAVVGREQEATWDDLGKVLQGAHPWGWDDENRQVLALVGAGAPGKTAANHLGGQGWNKSYLVGTEGLEPSLRAF
jgi:site-specific DNA recombinase